MPEPEPKKAVHNAGAFLGPFSVGSVPVPMQTLSDEYHDEAAEPEDSDRIPAPERPGRLQRFVDRIRPNRHP